MVKGRIFIFIRSILEELKYKVTWPSYEALQRSATLVIISSFVFALLIGIMDVSLTKVFLWFYNTFSKKG